MRTIAVSSRGAYHVALRLVLLSLSLTSCLGDWLKPSLEQRAENTSISASNGRILPKAPDFAFCNGYYGVELQEIGCREALRGLDEQWGGRNAKWVHLGKVMQKHYWVNIVPLVFRDNPTQTICKITIDLGGNVKDQEGSLYLWSNDIVETAKGVIDKCIVEDKKETGGFGTLKLSRTISGMADAKLAPHGYEAPFFATVSISEDKPPSLPVGDVDPIVNEKLQIALQAKIEGAMFKRTKDKIRLVINALVETYVQMTRGGKKAWWDTTRFVPAIPDNVSNLCRRNYGHPNEYACERASFNFIKAGMTPQIKQGKPIVFEHGTCVFEVKTEGAPVTASWDMVRSVADSLLNECLIGEGYKTGGEALYVGNSQINNSTSISARDDQNSTDDSNAIWPRDLVVVLRELGKPSGECLSSNSTNCVSEGITAVQSGAPLPQVSTIETS